MSISTMVALSVERTYGDTGEVERNDTYYPINSLNFSSEHFDGGEGLIFYTPSNDKTDKLMELVRTCLHLRKDQFSSFDTEDLLVNASLTKRHEELLRTDQSLYSTNVTEIVGVVFDFHDSKKLKYKLRPTTEMSTSLFNSLMNHQRNSTESYIDEVPFVQIQNCIDKSFVDTVSVGANSQFAYNLTIQRMPDPPHVNTSHITIMNFYVLPVVVLIAFGTPFCVEALFPLQEKASGVKRLLALNGVPSYINLLSWLVSSTLFAIMWFLLVTLITYYLSHLTGYSVSLPLHPIIYHLFVMFQIVHFVTFGLHVSAYFSRPGAMIATWNFIVFASNVLHSCLFESNYHNLIQYLGIIFPNMLMRRAVEELNTYVEMNSSVHIHNMFASSTSNYKSLGSIGFIIIFEILGSLLHFWSANIVCNAYLGKKPKLIEKWEKMYLDKKGNSSWSSSSRIEEASSSRNNIEQTANEDFNCALKMSGLHKTYVDVCASNAGTKALHNLSLNVCKGKITVVHGYSKCGKSTLMTVLTGAIRPSAGIVTINNQEPAYNYQEVLYNVGVCPQDNLLFPSLNTLQQLELICRLKTTKNIETVREDSKVLLKQLNLYSRRYELPEVLTISEKRRLSMAMALIAIPEVLILDEPTLGMDEEHKKYIWNLLVKMKEDKTIIIASQDIEETEIIGDKIAFLHQGKIDNCGSPDYLTKLYGYKNLEVRLTTELWSDPLKLKSEFPEGTEIVVASKGKVILSAVNSEGLAKSLDNMEQNKSSNGVTEIHVSQVSLEDVYLKTIGEDDANNNSMQPSVAFERPTSSKVYKELQHTALYEKKMTYVKKNNRLYLLIFLLPLIPLVLIAMMESDDTESTPLTLSLYDSTKALYTSDIPVIGDTYRKIIEVSGGDAIPINHHTINEALLALGKENMAIYKYDTIISAEFNKSADGIINANALYSSAATLSIPISVNVVSNTLLKATLGEEYNIEVIYQELPGFSYRVYRYHSVDNAFNFLKSLLLCIFIFPAISLFIVQPWQENASRMKSLQRLSGISSLTYWTSTFFVDLAIFLCFTLFTLMGLVLFDLIFGGNIYHITELVIMALLLILFGINVLPFLYIITFRVKSLYSAILTLCTLPILILIFYHTFEEMYLSYPPYVTYWFYFLNRILFYAVPFVSFFRGQMSFYSVADDNARCRKMPKFILDFTCANPEEQDFCCELNCKGGYCEKSFSYFNNADDGYDLLFVIVLMCIYPFVYLAILRFLESRTLKPPKVCNNSNEKKSCDCHCCLPGFVYRKNRDIEDPKDNEPSVEKNFSLAYELCRRYGKAETPRFSLFTVKQGESLGLLDVDVTGKSAIFNTLTFDFGRAFSSYLTHSGYCSQRHIIIKSLNAHDHLRLFGRFRGIPSSCLDAEVNRWVNQLGLKDVAYLPTSLYNDGQRKKLNIAMALIGNPSLVFLDQPTSRTDPATKKLLWNVLRNNRNEGQTIIFTSNSIRECGILCNRLVTMKKDQLLRISPSEEQKLEYEAGYDIVINLNYQSRNEDVISLRQYLVRTLDCEVISEDLTRISYHVTNAQTSWQLKHKTLSLLKTKYKCIKDFTVLSASLQQFLIQSMKFGDDTKNCSVIKIDRAYV